MTRHKKYSEEIKQEAINLYLTTDLSCPKIAEKLGTSKQLINYWLNKAGVRNLNTKIKHEEFFPEDEEVLGYICGLLLINGSMDKKSKIVKFSHGNKELVFWMARNLKIGTVNSSNNIYSFARVCPKLYNFVISLKVSLINKSEVFKKSFLKGIEDSIM